MDYGQFEFEPCSATILSRRGFNFDDTARLQYSTRPGQTSVLDPAYFTHPTSLVYCERKQKKRVITIQRVSFEFLLYVKKTSMESLCKVCTYSDNPF